MLKVAESFPTWPNMALSGQEWWPKLVKSGPELTRVAPELPRVDPKRPEHNPECLRVV